MIKDAFREFIAKYPSKTYRKGETILLKGDKPKVTYVIESGMVKTYSLAANGDERLVSLEREGGDFPIGLALNITQECPYFYEAFNKCTVRLIPKEEYRKYVGSNPRALAKRYIRLTNLLLSTLSRVHALEQPNACSKIAHTLIYMAEQLGVSVPARESKLKISVTQQEIANASGLTRETANVELKKLESLNLITHSRHSYILNMGKLRMFVERQ